MKTSLRTFTCLLTAPLLALTFNSNASAADAPMVSTMDKTFVKKATIGGMFEVETGKLAGAMGTSQGVKDFGNKMVEDHGKAGDELKGIVSSKSIDAPTALDAKHEKMVEELKAKSGKDFDALYLKDMKMAHTMDDALFEKEASSGKDADLKAFAEKTDKVIKMHISMLKDTMAGMK